jgi:PKD repeat protein
MAVGFLVALAGPALALPAFPGAEGYGTDTVHGRGGIIVEVTNLNDSGAGSLRDACENYTVPRIVVFRVGGTIISSGYINVREANSYLYVAGQTAPGDGIQIKGDGFQVLDGGHDVVLRYLRIRPGETATEDCVTVWGNNGYGVYRHTYNVVVDHCSLEWSPDENANVWDQCDGVTFQWCIIAEGLVGHSMGFISGFGMGNKTNTLFDIEVALHHNLFAHNEGRNPYFKQGRDGPADFRNNVVYNWLNNNVGQVEYGQQANFVANYYKAGPDVNWGGIILVPDGQNRSGIQIYVEGNWGPFCPSGCPSNEWDIGIAYYQGGHITAPEDKYRMWSPYFPPTVTTHTASQAYDLVLAGAGATLPSRDAADTHIVNDVINGTGHCGKNSDWPNLQGGTPPTDTDHDGMPDSWETSHGLNPNDPADRNGDLDGDGYTNVEEYLNGTDPGQGQPQPPVAQFSGNPTSGAAPLTVNFTDLSTGSPTSWSWNFGDSGTSTAQNPSHQYTTANQFTVSLQACNAQGCDTETKNNYITVTSGGNPPVAQFSGNPTSGPAPLTVNFTDQSTNSPTSWSWNFGDTGTSTAQNPSHQYTTANTYTVSLTATNAYGSDDEVKANYITVTSGGGGDFFCDSITMVQGTLDSGSHTDTHASDNVYMVCQSAQSGQKHYVQVDYTFNTGLGGLSSLGYTVEAHHDNANAFTWTAKAWNYTTSAWDTVGSWSVPTGSSDTTYSDTISNPSNYISGGVVKLKVVANKGQTWKAFFDLVKITAQP